MLNKYSDDQLRLTSRLYYIEGMGQSEVAKFVKVSQSKVSRMLLLARERGIVRITVTDYDPRDKDLEIRLRANLGLSAVVVVKTTAPSTPLEPGALRKSIGMFAAPALDALIKKRDIVALSGGRTICELVKSLPETGNKALTVVQTMGSVDSNISDFDSQEVGRMLARRLGGSFHSMNTPAYLPGKKMRDDLLALPQISMVHKDLARANVALVGLGTLRNSVFIERRVLGDRDVRELEDKGAVGEICGRFYDKEGTECATSWRDRVMSISLENLQSIPMVIAVVPGDDRSDSILAAIKGGFLNGLVLDDNGARALLALSKDNNPKRN